MMRALARDCDLAPFPMAALHNAHARGIKHPNTLMLLNGCAREGDLKLLLIGDLFNSLPTIYLPTPNQTHAIRVNQPFPTAPGFACENSAARPSPWKFERKLCGKMNVSLREKRMTAYGERE
jgi:hypothetical protein